MSTADEFRSSYNPDASETAASAQPAQSQPENLESGQNQTSQNQTSGSVNPSLEEMMAQAQQLQASMQQAQENLSSARVEGQAENGAVRALVSGTGVLLDLRIAPAVINPQDPQTLINLILAAVHDAGEKATAMQERVLNEISPEMVSMLGGEPQSAVDASGGVQGGGQAPGTSAF